MNIQSPTSEFRHLIRILQGGDIAHPDCNTDHLLQLIADHRVIGQVARKIQNFEDSALRAKIETENIANKLAQLRLIEVLTELKNILTGIHFVLLKGPGLSQQIYNDPAERRSRDLDILIHPKDFDRVMEQLTQAGYRKLTYYKTSRQRASLMKHYQNIELEHPSGELHIEIHWNLVSLRSAKCPTIEELETEELKLGSQSWLTPGLYDNLCYLCLHGTLHAFFRLQWLLDIRELRKKMMDESEFIAHLTKWEWTIYYLVACELLHHFFEDELPKYPEGISRKKVRQISQLCLKEIARNDSYLHGSHNDGGFRASWVLHRLRFLCGGWKSLLNSLISRNIRPDNWAFFAFPDPVFFLNALFSRPIWLCRKIFSKSS